MSKRNYTVSELENSGLGTATRSLAAASLRNYVGTNLSLQIHDNEVVSLVGFVTKYDNPKVDEIIIRHYDKSISNYPIKKVHPFLQSKLSKHQSAKYRELKGKNLSIKKIDKLLRFLYANHYDVRGLIDNNIAIEKEHYSDDDFKNPKLDTPSILQHYVGTDLLLALNTGEIVSFVGFMNNSDDNDIFIRHAGGKLVSSTLKKCSPILVKKLTKNKRLEYQSILGKKPTIKQMDNAIRFLYKNHYDVTGLIDKKIAIQKKKVHVLGFGKPSIDTSSKN